MKYDLIHNRMKYFLKEYSNFHEPLYLQGISSIFTIFGENAGVYSKKNMRQISIKSNLDDQFFADLCALYKF